MNLRRPRAVAAFAVVASLTLNLSAQVDRLTGGSFATRPEVIAQHGIVCTSHPLARQIGLDVRQAGGSAVDAAIGRRLVQAA